MKILRLAIAFLFLGTVAAAFWAGMHVQERACAEFSRAFDQISDAGVP